MPQRICSIEGCEKSHRAPGFCTSHYNQWSKHGDPLACARSKPSPCSVDGCEVISKARGWCVRHYNRWRRHGDPTAGGRPSAETRFWERTIVAQPQECWLWTGGTTKHGYGDLYVDGHHALAHRFAYKLLVGPIPEGLTLDHLCRVRHCVNPAHLEPVTNAENIRRGQSFAARMGRRTHCKHGHPFDGSTRMRPNGKPTRYCRICERERSRQKGRERTAARRAALRGEGVAE